MYVISKKVIIFTSYFSGEVLFNYSHPEEPPDFIFSPEDSEFAPEMTDIKVMLTFI